MPNLYAPNGKRIIGTLETILGVALIHGAERENDKLLPEWTGETEVDWDSQETVSRDGQIVFVDEDGAEWLESQVELREDETEDEA